MTQHQSQPLQPVQPAPRPAPNPADHTGAAAAIPLIRYSPLFVFSRYGALLVAWVATCGSLFFSEVLGWLPCELCWYQRILMYPLAVLIAVGILRRDEQLHTYVLPLSLLGAATSFYHYLLIKTDIFPPPACSGGIPCTVDYIDLFGFINIPFLALTAFLLISLALVLSNIQPPQLVVAGQEADESMAEPVAPGRPATVVGVIAVIVVTVGSFVAAAGLI